MTEHAHVPRDNGTTQNGSGWKEGVVTDDFSPHIPEYEFNLRIAKAKKLLAKHGLDAMILFAEENKYYYGGYRDAIMMWTDRWRHCFIVSQEHDPVFVGEAILDSNVRRTTWVRDARYWSGVKVWRVHIAFIDVLVDTLIDLKLDNKVIGMEYGAHHIPQVGIDEVREVEAALPNARFVSAEKVIWEQKMIKTEWEITLMREMCAKATRVLEKGWRSIKPGVTEREVNRVIWQEWVNEDMFETPCMSNPLLFLSGTDAPNKFRIVTTPFYDRVIKKGDQGFSDAGPSYKGYWTDLQRNFYVGDKLPAKYAELSKKGKAAYMNTVEKVIPGMRACDVHMLAERETLRQDIDQIVPIEFVGHGIGTMNHEPPWLAPDDLTELQTGMVLCVEVGCYDIEFVYMGNMPEDIWLVTDSGLELLGVDLPRDVWLCG
jgi:Xaa-Pro aminopeptidase